ncbi:CehA/McbA family metallohydrolase [Pelagibacteraceae bacterium]|nr:CehA/McbA family metallohydrolase [Pelagibacteraceae bacterium]
MHLLPSKNKYKYFKGNLHGHSNHSDGALNPQEVVNRYNEIGYDFTCLSDHLWKDTNFAAETVLETKHLNQKDFITIRSAELHCLGKKYIKDGLWHIVANGLPLNFKCADEKETAPRLVQRAIEAGAFVTIAHPEWYSLTFDECLALSHAHGIEIYNHSCHIEAQRGFGTAAADYLLQENKRIFLTATDDSHFKMQDAGGGWVMVAADKLSESSILNALKNGQYYSSTGVEILEFEINNHEVNIQCSPSNQVCLVGQGAKSMSQNGKNITQVEFSLKKYPSEWFRVSIANDSGEFAWTNPVWL